MRWEALVSACAVGLLVTAVGATEGDALPSPWFRTGSAAPADKCRIAVIPVKAAGFDRSLMIRCDGTTSGFATVMQQVAADDYRGKRVRLSAQVRGDHVQQWSGLWMRIDGDQNRSLAFDNMRDRPLTGTFDWRPASVVLDVPATATSIAFGVLQDGDGATYTGAIGLDIVSADVAVTGGERTLPKAPRNLSLGR